MALSKSDVCNLALSRMGNFSTIENIDTPTTDHELTFALWYDISRKAYLSICKPNFALARKVVAKVAETPPNPFINSYERPSDALKILGIGAIEDKKNDYTVEANRIYTDVTYEDGMPLRYVKNITDVSTMTPEFIIGLANYLAFYTALAITQDVKKAELLQKAIDRTVSDVSGLSGQENMPIRITKSQFKTSRQRGLVGAQNKR